MPERRALSRERIVDAAAAVADRGGLPAVSMRNVGRELGVEAMSLYHHVARKDDLLDALADWVFELVELPLENESWRDGMVRRARSARVVLTRHRWALGLIESRPPGPALLRHHNAVLGCLRRGGFSVALASHAFSVIDAYVYGFALTELTIPADTTATATDFVAGAGEGMSEYPHLTEMIEQLVIRGDYAFADEFDYGLDVILDELERRLMSGGQPS